MDQVTEMSGLVDFHYLDGAAPFNSEQCSYSLPDRDVLVARNTRSVAVEPWFEDTFLVFDIVSAWVSYSFRISQDHWQQRLPMVSDKEMLPRVGVKNDSEFALDFYSAGLICVSSDEEPAAAEVAHWFRIYAEARVSWNVKMFCLDTCALIRYLSFLLHMPMILLHLVV